MNRRAPWDNIQDKPIILFHLKDPDWVLRMLREGGTFQVFHEGRYPFRRPDGGLTPAEIEAQRRWSE